MSDPSPGPVDLDEMPASTGEIYERIDAQEPISRQTLLEETYYSVATVDRALSRLESAGYIRRDRRKQDLRTVVCHTEH